MLLWWGRGKGRLVSDAVGWRWSGVGGRVLEGLGEAARFAGRCTWGSEDGDLPPDAAFGCAAAWNDPLLSSGRLPLMGRTAADEPMMMMLHDSLSCVHHGCLDGWDGLPLAHAVLGWCCEPGVVSVLVVSPSWSLSGDHQILVLRLWVVNWSF